MSHRPHTHISAPTVTIIALVIAFASLSVCLYQSYVFRDAQLHQDGRIAVLTTQLYVHRLQTGKRLNSLEHHAHQSQRRIAP